MSEMLAARVAELEAELAKARALVDEVTAERDRLREGYRHLQLEVELMRRRLVVAKAERVDTKQLELEFAAKLRELDRLAGLAPDAAADPEVTESRRRKRNPKAAAGSPSSTCPRSASS